MKIRQLNAAMLAVAAIVAVASASVAASGGPVDPADPADVATGPGVSDDTIVLGVLADLSGPFAPVSEEALVGSQLYWDQRNADGGVCGRTVDLVVQDHGYNPQQASTLYTAMAPDVAALQQLFGSPTTAAVQDQIAADRMLTGTGGYSPSLLANDAMVILGTPFDVEAVNAVDYLVRERGLAAGATVGVVNFPGEFGESVRAGVEAAAGAFGLDVHVQEITPDVTDMTPVLSGLADSGIHHIVSGTSFTQVAGLAFVAEAADYELTILTPDNIAPGAFEDDGTVDVLAERVIVASSRAPFEFGDDVVAGLHDSWIAEHAGETPSSFLNFGVLQASVFDQTLQRACANGDLTREGIVTAFHELDSVDVHEFNVGLDFSTPGAPPSLETYILGIDPDAEWKLAVIEEPFVSDAAAAYAAATFGS